MPADPQKTCPLCSADNHCSGASGTDCWCFHETIPAHILASIPADKQDQICICQNCIKAINLPKK